MSNNENKNLDQVTEQLTKTFVWTAKHSQLVVGLIVIFIIAGGGVTLFSSLSKKSELQAQEEYFKIEKKFNDKKNAYLNEVQKQKMASSAPVDKKNKKNDNLSAPEIKKPDYMDNAAEFISLTQAHQGKVAAQMASLKSAEIYIESGKTEEALGIVEKTLSKGIKSHLLKGLHLQLKAQILMESQKFEEAIAVLNEILSDKAIAYLHDETKLNLAISYEKTQQKDKALNIYTEMTQPKEGATNTEVSRQAAQYLRLLKITL